MNLLFIYLGLVIVGNGADYVIGLAVEKMWGTTASLVVFLALYFATFWLAWLASVWLTQPKAAASPASG